MCDILDICCFFTDPNDCSSKKKRGRRGATGPTGSTGSTGLTGATGPTGSAPDSNLPMAFATVPSSIAEGDVITIAPGEDVPYTTSTASYFDTTYFTPVTDGWDILLPGIYQVIFSVQIEGVDTTPGVLEVFLEGGESEILTNALTLVPLGDEAHTIYGETTILVTAASPTVTIRNPGGTVSFTIAEAPGEGTVSGTFRIQRIGDVPTPEVLRLTKSKKLAQPSRRPSTRKNVINRPRAPTPRPQQLNRRSQSKRQSVPPTK